MNRKFNWPLAVAVFVMALGAVFFFSYWHRETMVSAPIEHALEPIEGISEVEVKDNGDELEISVSLRTEHLPSSYSEIEEEISSLRTPGSYIIHLRDRRNPHLTSLYDKIHFSILEAERQGNYREMNREVMEILEEQHELHHYGLWVDKQRIYLQLSDAKGYLYEIIEIKDKTSVNP